MVGVGTLIGLALTIIIGLPVLVKYGVYYLHTPNIHIAFETLTCPLYWMELEEVGITIRNDSNSRYTFEMEIRIDQQWEYKSEDLNKQYHTQFRNGFHAHRLEKFADREIILSKDSARGFPIFPLQPKEESAIIEVVVHPEVELSEFGFPEFFPRVSLQRVKKECYVTDELTEFFSHHEQGQRLRQLNNLLEEKVNRAYPNHNHEEVIDKFSDTKDV